MLIGMRERGERATGYGDQISESHRVTPILADLGVTKMQSSRWQEIADIPEPVFERYIELGREKESHELTTSGLKTLVKLEEKADQIEAIRKEPPPLPQGPFRVIVIDPPWQYGARAQDGTHRARNPYPDMTLEEIAKLDVRGRHRHQRPGVGF